MISYKRNMGVTFSATLGFPVVSPCVHQPHVSPHAYIVNKDKGLASKGEKCWVLTDF